MTRIASIVIALALACGAVTSALAQSQPNAGEAPETPCFEVVPLGPHGSEELAVAFMVNRCNGKTWYLVRASATGYLWVPIPRSDR